MNVANGQLIVIGASGRAAAFSALRGGYTPTVLDLFADADLRSRCPVYPVPHDAYPGELVAAANRLPPSHWLYVGGLENHPDLVAAISRRHHLLGNPAHVLRRVRDPFEVTESLQGADFLAPDVVQPPTAKCIDGSWLLKPKRGAGGRGIVPWHGQRVSGSGHYVQRWVDGVPLSMAFLARGHDQAIVLGVTRQLLGEAWLGVTGYTYCGSMGPLTIPAVVQLELRRLAQFLTNHFGLMGLVGVDFVLDHQKIQPIEINPRYTASMELIEATLKHSLVRLHAAALLNETEVDLHEAATCWGKAILFARRDLTFPTEGPWLDDVERPLQGFAPPHYADVPIPGAAIPARSPILTCFVKGDSPDECLRRLRSEAQVLDQVLGNE